MAHDAIAAQIKLASSVKSKIIDTVHDLPNVLYEVANESSGDTGDSVKLPDGTTIATPIGDSTEWQYGVIEFVKQYEQRWGTRSATPGR